LCDLVEHEYQVLLELFVQVVHRFLERFEHTLFKELGQGNNIATLGAPFEERPECV
jgi:hypothetical protein